MRKVLNFLTLAAGTVVFLVAKLLGFKTPVDTEAQGFADDGLLRVPIRLLPEVANAMIEDWFPIGFGATHLASQPDGSFDLIYKEADLSRQHNLVKLDSVNEALMAALDLAHSVRDAEYEVPEETTSAAREVEKLIQRLSS